MEIRTELSSLETPSGQVLEFTCRFGQGADAMLTEGALRASGWS